MKTTKLIAKIGLTILATFLIVSSTFAQGKGIARVKKPGEGVLGPIIYKVNVHLSNQQLYGNTYRIALTNQNGSLIAGTQTFNPSESIYIFNEYATVSRTTTRIARFILVPDNFIGLNVLKARSDVKTGVFLNGHTYLFNLYPTNQVSKE
jgi:hypothetical protein